MAWLEHDAPNCTGEWWGWHGCTVDFWRCDKCGASHMDTPEVRTSAIQHMAIGLDVSLELAARPTSEDADA